VTIARGHAELIRNMSSDSGVSDDAVVIIDELDRLAMISQRLLLLAGRSGPDFLHPAPLDLEVLVDTAARRWRVVASRDWQVDVEPGAVVIADGGRLGSALDALLENAVRHTGERDRIEIRARGEGSQAVIEVSDTGDGIAPEQLTRIFDRFARTPGSRGSGLGLAIVKAIAGRRWGVSWAKSTRTSSPVLSRRPARSSTSTPQAFSSNLLRTFWMSRKKRLKELPDLLLTRDNLRDAGILR